MNFGAGVLGRALLLALLCAQPTLIMAQSSASGAAYPSHSVRLVVPFPPGASPNDIIGRLIGKVETGADQLQLRGKRDRAELQKWAKLAREAGIKPE